ncbi:Hypothetical predicted protein [Marmota monax]|uniref:Uncharacterized protein n=1 Tax=Marmota monax TaxID=9995 RepID=A0A5E4A9A6_MARMO|nr:Hypothetical predicted protein [Marmota monax]
MGAQELPTWLLLPVAGSRVQTWVRIHLQSTHQPASQAPVAGSRKPCRQGFRPFVQLRSQGAPEDGLPPHRLLPSDAPDNPQERESERAGEKSQVSSAYRHGERLVIPPGAFEDNQTAVGVPPSDAVGSEPQEGSAHVGNSSEEQ